MTANRLGSLIDSKAWDLLGMTGQEFLRAWYAGQFKNDHRPEVAALARLVSTGEWVDPPSPIDLTEEPGVRSA